MYAEKMINLKIFINYKNLVKFTIIKQSNQKQIKWSKLFE